MRWDDLFADLEAQLEAAGQAELTAEVADRSRREHARLRLVDRLRGAATADVVVHVLGAQVVTGRLTAVGADWVLVAEQPGRDALVPMDAVLAVGGLRAWSAPPGGEGRVAARLTLGHALRGIARDRAPVAVSLRDGSVVRGTVDRVGADFVEVAEHAAGEVRRPTEVRAVRALPYLALAVLRAS